MATIYRPGEVGPKYEMSDGNMPSGKLSDKIPLNRLDVWDKQLSHIITLQTNNVLKSSGQIEPLAKQARNWKFGYGCTFVILAICAAGVLFVLPKHLDFSSKISSGVAGGLGGLAVVGFIVTVRKVKSTERQIVTIYREIGEKTKKAASAREIVNDKSFLFTHRFSFVSNNHIDLGKAIDFNALYNWTDTFRFSRERHHHTECLT